MQRAEEILLKHERVRQLLEERDLRGLLLRSRANFAWITAGGRSTVNETAEQGVAAVLATREGLMLLSSNIERQRLEEEQLGPELAGRLFECVDYPWWHPEALASVVKERCPDGLGVDAGPGGEDLGAEVAGLRASLTAAEVGRLRRDARLAAATVEGVAHQVRPGMSERAVAALLRYALAEQGFGVAVCLVGADGRMAGRRHPVPTDLRIRERALLVAVAERCGLHAAVSRLVSFGPVEPELARRHRAVCAVHATAAAATRPDTPMREVLAQIQAAYEREGFAGEWRHHHQGGPTGYAPRDRIVHPGVETPVALHQPFAWNPTIAGTKCEDTVLAADTPESLAGPGEAWPAVQVERGGRMWRGADILVPG